MMTQQTVPFLNFYGSRGGIINYHALLYTFMMTQHTVPFWIFYGNRLSYTFMMTHQTGAFWNFYGRRGWESGGKGRYVGSRGAARVL